VDEMDTGERAMTEPTHIKPGLDALLKKLEVKRNQWKVEQEQDRWIIERGRELDDQFLEVFGDERNRKHDQ